MDAQTFKNIDYEIDVGFNADEALMLLTDAVEKMLVAKQAIEKVKCVNVNVTFIKRRIN